jgi:hypothetical protein
MSDLPNAPEAPANVVPLKQPEPTITDLVSFEAEVVRRLEEDGYEDVSNPVSFGQVDKLFLAQGSIEKGAAYPGLPETVVVALFATSQGGATYINGDVRIFIAPKGFGAAERHLVVTINRKTSNVLAMRAALDRDGFIDAVVSEWAFCFEGDEDADPGCFAEDCENDVVFICECTKCEGRVYATCLHHRPEVDQDHLKVQERPTKWAKIASEDLPS